MTVTNTPTNYQLAAQQMYRAAYADFMKSNAPVHHAALGWRMAAVVLAVRLVPPNQAEAILLRALDDCGSDRSLAEEYLKAAIFALAETLSDADVPDHVMPDGIAGLAVGSGLLADFFDRDFFATPRELRADHVVVPKFLLNLLPADTFLGRCVSAPRPTDVIVPDAIVSRSTATLTIQEAMDNWIIGLSRGEQSRRRSSVELLAKTAGLRMYDSVALLERLDARTGAQFHRLSKGVGAGWGQARDERTMDAGPLLKLVTGRNPPRWSQKPLSSSGARNRVAHAKAFLNMLEGLNLRIPAIDWPKL